MVRRWQPDRGDILLLQFHPQRGREQSGYRPALVLSPRSYNMKVGLVLLCPITSKEKGYPFEVLLPSSLKTKGVILSDHIKSLDWSVRGARFVERVPKGSLEQVLLRVEALLHG